jgi:lysophospholipase L1-like esterase
MGRVLVGHALWFALAVAGFAAPAAAAGKIEWRLENPFRLFKNPEATELHRKIYEGLSTLERQSPILSAERKLESRFGGRGWADTVFNETCYDQENDRYTACPDYILPKSHRIIARFRKQGSFWDLFEPGAPDGRCRWTLADRAGKTISEETAACDATVKLDIPYPSGGRLTVSPAGGASSSAIDIRIRDLLIIGMGDSFGAGEGNPDHPVKFDDSRSFDYGTVDIAVSSTRQRLDGYPAREGAWTRLESAGFRRERARWWDRECHRSLYSHQLRAALQLAIEDPQRAVTFVGFSCGGAEITQGVLLSTPVRECTAGEGFSVPSQMSAMSQELCAKVTRNAPMPAAIIERTPELRSVAESQMRMTRCQTTADGGAERPALKRPIDLVLLSVGGNDVGFVPLVADGMLSASSIYRRLGERMSYVYGTDRARARLALVKQRFDGLKLALELFLGVKFGRGHAPGVILSGYPLMGYGTDGITACRGTAGLEVFPPFELDEAKIGNAEQFSSEFNRTLANIAGRDWTYVDGFRADFQSHGLCATRSQSLAETLSFPRLKDGVWTPFKPSLYPPYAPRQRWFRTPNDAFLTSNMHPETLANFGGNCSRFFSGALRTVAHRYWTPFQLFLASTYGGAFHPTAEGQARMADDVADAARAAIERGS